MNKFLWKIHKSIFRSKGKVAWLDKGDSCYIVQMNKLNLSLRLHRFKVSMINFEKNGDYTLYFTSELALTEYDEYPIFNTNITLSIKFSNKLYNGKLFIDNRYGDRCSCLIFASSKDVLLKYVQDLYKHHCHAYAYYRLFSMTPQEYYKQFYRKAISTILDYNY